jgi:RNA polymerase-binding transcription factor DksA
MAAKRIPDLEPYKAKLRQLYRHLTDEHESLEEAGLHENFVDETGDRPGADTHPADAGTELFLRERDQLLENNLEYILEQCKRALEKIEEGTYGYSDESGEFIGVERLDAAPYATLTVAEQERFISG